MKTLIMICAVLLSGCSASPDGNYKAINCTGQYMVKTFPVNDIYPVKLNAVRENRFGEKQYRVAPSQKFVTFVHRWQREDKFEIVECKSE